MPALSTLCPSNVAIVRCRRFPGLSEGVSELEAHCTTAIITATAVLRRPHLGVWTFNFYFDNIFAKLLNIFVC